MSLVSDPFAMTAQREPDFAPSRVPLVGTDQQETFWGELQSGSGHVVLEARAGTGKSSSCREGMWRLLGRPGPKPSIRYCCFNKAIADEFAAACPPGVEVGTMHKFGLQAVRRAFGQGQVSISAEKTYTLIDAMPGGPELKRYVRRSISRIVSLAKNHALRPGQPDLLMCLLELQIQYDVECWNQVDSVLAWSAAILAKSAEMTSIVDFDDMLWLPLVCGLNFPTVDFLFIDEAQDLNPVQHELADRMNRSGRTIVVGDPFQAIYAFRGADSDSIPNLRAALGAATLPLTITWRCPASHVELARTLVPDLEAAPAAPEGVLRTGCDLAEELADAEPGDLFLCRANAPIVSACLKLIGGRRKAIVRGRSFGDSLMSIVREVEASTIPAFVRGVSVWNAREVERLERRDGTEHLVEQANDKSAALIAVAETCGSPAEVPGVLNGLFADTSPAGCVTFSSVHRAKGSEAANVRYLQIPYGMARDRVKPPPKWELDQRRNLRYVALTRSKNSLSLIESASRKGSN